MGFPGGSVVNSPSANAGDAGDSEFDPCIGKTPWRKKQQLTPVFLPGKYPGQRSLAGYHPYGGKELDVTEHTQNQPIVADRLTSLPVHQCCTQGVLLSSDRFSYCVLEGLPRTALSNRNFSDDGRGPYLFLLISCSIFYKEKLPLNNYFATMKFSMYRKDRKKLLTSYSLLSAVRKISCFLFFLKK